MQIQKAIQNIFIQLSETINQLNNEQYTQPSKVLFNATIGQHIRHIIELFQGLEIGYESGTVNYEKRKRDLTIETNKAVAASLLNSIYQNLNKPDKDLILESNYDEHSAEIVGVNTNYYRELIYNLEHAVHHMALIRVGIMEVSEIQIPEGYGVATSTIKFKQGCAQ